jgi:hypothetical protein
MAGYRRQYTWTVADASALTRLRLQRLLDAVAVEEPRWMKLTVHDAFGVLQFSATILGRDQWWCREMAMNLQQLVADRLRLSITTAESKRAAPHTNRGRRRIRGDRVSQT